jgi:hypothetical protein
MSRSEPLFFILAFAASWAVWLPLAVMSGEPSALGKLAVGGAAAGPRRPERG